jgi:hypothetical protein
VLAAASTDSFDQAFAAENAFTTNGKAADLLVRRSIIATESFRINNFILELFILTAARVPTKTSATQIGHVLLRKV